MMIRTAIDGMDPALFFCYKPVPPAPKAAPPVAPKPYAKQHRVQPPVQPTTVKMTVPDAIQEQFWMAEARAEVESLFPKRG